jgi:hypothetical protein
MNLREKWRQLEQVPAVRTGLVVLGCLLLLLTPFVGVLPGPGGILVFGAGAALVLRYSPWAKRLYVRFKRRHPKKARWADWSLRRASARRREEAQKRLAARLAANAARERELDRIHRHDGQAALVLFQAEAGAVQYSIERQYCGSSPHAGEPYWATVRFSGLYLDVETARADGLRELEHV